MNQNPTHDFQSSNQTPYEDITSLNASKSVSFDLRDDRRVEITGIPPGGYVHQHDHHGIEDGDDEIRHTFSSMSSVMTADGIADPLSFQINCLVVFLGDTARGIFFPTMWNLVKTLGGDQVLLGYTIASFSFGRMMVLPLFGSWSVRFGYRWTLLFSTFVLLLGTLLFGHVLSVGKHWYLLFANTVVGIGSGTLGVTVAYASDVTPTRNRTSYMAWLTAVQYAGTSATPFIGSLFVVLFSRRGDEAWDYKGLPEINEFTAPALFMSFMSLLTMYLLYFHFQDTDPSAVANKSNSTRQKLRNDVGNTTICFGRITTYTACMVACMAMNAFTKGPMSCFETLGIEFAESRFDMQRATAGSIVATMGLIGTIALMVLRLYFNKFDDSMTISFGIIFFIIGIAMNFSLDRENPENNGSWRYVLSMFLSYSIGYPICHTAIIGLFSKSKCKKVHDYKSTRLHLMKILLYHF